MKTIAIVGANGQVGTEVTLLLSQLASVRVVPIVRSEYSASFLRRAGIACRIGAAGDREQTASLLEGADLVADFSLPGGLPSAVKRAVRQNVRAAIDLAPKGAAYAFISSTMAFGMAQDEGAYRAHALSRTPYSAQKREGERLAKALGALQERPIYVLRLGQVHGDLQGISREITEMIGARPIGLPRAGDVPSDVVFCTTIALALAHLAEGRDAPGTYSLVDSPAWTLREVYDHYAENAGKTVHFVDIGGGAPAKRSPAAGLVASGAALMSRHKNFLTAQLLPSWQSIEQRFKGPHLLRRTSAEIRASEIGGAITPRHFVGPVPGPRLPSLEGERDALANEARAMRALLVERFGDRCRIFKD